MRDTVHVEAMIANGIEDLELKSSDQELLDLIESPVWEDIKMIVSLMLGWEVGQLIEDSPEEFIKTQGRCLVLREIIDRIGDQVIILAKANNSSQHLDETNEEEE